MISRKPLSMKQTWPINMQKHNSWQTCFQHKYNKKNYSMHIKHESNLQLKLIQSSRMHTSRKKKIMLKLK